MNKFENFKEYFSELKEREDYSKSRKLGILLQEINENFDKMTNDFAKEILIEIRKSLDSSKSAQKIIGIIFEKNYSNINAEKTAMFEIPQFNTMIEEAVYQLLKQYDEMEDPDGKIARKRRDLLVDCYGKIVGREGTTNKVIEMLSVSDIDTIVRAKLDENGINNDELIELLHRRLQTITDDNEKAEFIELVEKTVIESVNEQPEKVKNPKIYKIFEMLIREYRKNNQEYAISTNEQGIVGYNQGQNNNSKKIEKIIELSDKVIESYAKMHGTYSEQYKEMCDEDFRLKTLVYEYETLSIEDIKKLISEAEQKHDIYLGTQTSSFESRKTRKLEGEHSETKTPVMSKLEKIEKMVQAISELRSEYPQYNISIKKAWVQKGKTSFEDYFIFPIEGLHCYLLERFDDESSSALYVVDSSDIREIFKLVQMKRLIVKSHPAVTAVNHNEKKNGTRYVDRVKKAIEDTMQADLLEELWESAYRVDEQIQASEERSEIIGNVEAQHEELVNLQKQYDSLIEKITEQEGRVARIARKKGAKGDRN